MNSIRALLAILLMTALIAPVGAAQGAPSPRDENGKILLSSFTRYLFVEPVGQYGPNDAACDLWTVNPDGTELTNITAGPGCDWAGVWSPDGSKIAFNSNRSGDHDVYVVNADGSGMQRLTTSPGNDYYPTWSPDGKRIAFLSDRSRGTLLVVAAVDGSWKRIVASLPGLAWSTDWSPQAPKILLTVESAYANHYATNDDEDIYVANLRTGSVRPLIASKLSEYTATWSPDGRHIAFAATPCPTCGGEIFIADEHGSRRRQVTDSPELDDWYPSWSPDGHSLLYSSSDEDWLDWDIYSIGVDGADARRVLYNPVTIDAAPDWQPTRR